MKCVILAGGKGTRLSEQTTTVPKPMLFVGNKPLLQHIIEIYVHQHVHEFIVASGYKSEFIYAWFLSQEPKDFYKHPVYDGTIFQFRDYSVHVVDTGLETMTGGRLRRIHKYLEPNRAFYFTYGDGVGNVDLQQLNDHFFPLESTMAALTVVHPEGRFGRAILNDGDRIVRFGEKVENETDWINGGFGILTPTVLSLIPNDTTNIEKDIFPFLAEMGLMQGYRHTGFWKCVDTQRDLSELNDLYKENGAVWLTR